MESNIKLYVVRSLRYMVRMLLLLGLVLLVLWFTNTLDMTKGESLKEIFISLNGAIILGLVILLAGIYPRLSFTTIVVHANLAQDHAQIMEAMEGHNYVLAKKEQNVMVFRSKSNMRRFMLRWDDAITVTGEGDYIAIEGLKREVVRVDAKLQSLLNNGDE